jgi:hypothetical protein
MKKFALASFAAVFILFAMSFAHGQSACADLGVDCRHPSTSSGSGSGNSNSRQQEDSGPSNHEVSKEWSDVGWEKYKTYKATRQSADFWEALRTLKKSVYYDEHMGPAYYGIVKLMMENNSHYYAAYWAKIARKKAEFGNNATGSMRDWFKAQEIDNQFLSDQEDYEKECSVHTEAAGQGETVDPHSDVMKTLRDCQKRKAALDKDEAKRDKEVADYNKKYNSN